ncbi:MAG: hypothetical protein COA45_07890 [Zetaproteobacteria bacterium]|nr:MAG: hypothetical protein COA45_07890 [Zetaproteobacteria bacterium]
MQLNDIVPEKFDPYLPHDVRELTDNVIEYMRPYIEDMKQSIGGDPLETMQRAEEALAAYEQLYDKLHNQGLFPSDLSDIPGQISGDMGRELIGRGENIRSVLERAQYNYVEEQVEKFDDVSITDFPDALAQKYADDPEALQAAMEQHFYKERIEILENLVDNLSTKSNDAFPRGSSLGDIKDMIRAEKDALECSQKEHGDMTRTMEAETPTANIEPTITSAEYETQVSISTPM